MFESILFAFLIVAGLGAILGLGLAIAEKKLSEEKDPKLAEIENSMPNANCGGCGFAGCSSYAAAVFKGEAQPNLCVVGGQALADKISSVLGVESQKIEKCYPFVFCKGTCSDKSRKYNYYGVKDCNAAAMLLGGDNLCNEGCLHLGSCIKACNQDALYMDEAGIIHVNRSKCIGCGNCAKVCPKGVIRMIPENQKFAVSCNSHQKGSEVRAICDSGCIGCKICQVKFPESGFTVENNLATASLNADYEKQKEAALACPRKVIEEII